MTFQSVTVSLDMDTKIWVLNGKDELGKFEELPEVLNGLGSQGFHCVTAMVIPFSGMESVTLIFNRPVLADPEPPTPKRKYFGEGDGE